MRDRAQAGLMIQPLECRRLLAVLGLDITFGHAGTASVPGYFTEENDASRILPDGKVLLVGLAVSASATPSYTASPLVARFNPDGTLDTSFDGDGVLFLQQSITPDEVTFTTAAFGPDGKPVLFYAKAEHHSAQFFRFNADGTVDNSFGLNGVVSHDFGPIFAAYPHTVAVQPDGKIVFAFRVHEDDQVRLGRMNVDGSLDAGFAGGSPTTGPTGLSSSSEMRFGTDGKIYIEGFAPRQYQYYDNAVVARFNTDGSLDKTWGGGDGFADEVDTSSAKLVNGDPEAPSGGGRIYFDKSGRILVYQIQTFHDVESVHVTRFTTDGLLDPAFGDGDGDTTIVPAGVDFSNLSQLAVDSKGRVRGAFGTAGHQNLFRLRTDGTLDSSFGPDGIVSVPAPGDTRWSFTDDATLGFYHLSLSVQKYVANVKSIAVDAFGELIVNGTNEADSISIEPVGDQLILHLNGQDTPFPLASVKSLIIDGGAGGDTISTPSGFAASIHGGSGNDTITAGAADVTLFGETGNDKISCGNGNHTIDLGPGNDRATTGAGNDSIVGSLGDDRITTGPGNDTIDAGAGDDVITCGSGNDLVFSSSGNDTVHGGAGNDVVQDVREPPDVGEAGSGISYVGTDTGRKTYFGDEGNDILTGSAAGDVLFGNGGRDFIFGNSGDDFISGGGGMDSLYGGEAYEDQYLLDRSDRDTINGGEADDTITGSHGDDTLSGDAGNDTIISLGGADFISGGDGNDSITGADKDTLYGNGGADLIQGGIKPELIRGGGGRDTLKGGGGNDTIHGDDAADKIYGQGGNNQLFGDGGDDRIFGDNSGRDTLHGGGGNDLLITRDDGPDLLFGDAGTNTAIADKTDLLDGVIEG